MEIKKLFTDDSAVSPVIGVILMVAITVILAAVIAAFVLGLGSSGDVSPQTSFSYDYDSDGEELTITVQSGDSFTAGQVTFQGENFDQVGNSWDQHDANAGDGSATVRSGARAVLGDGTAGNGDDVPSNFDLNIVWESSDGDDSAIIGSRSGPAA